MYASDCLPLRLSDLFSDLSAVHLEHNLIRGVNEYENKSNEYNFSSDYAYNDSLRND